MLRVTLLALVVFVAFEHTAQAQNAILAQLYGQGVHAYYSGDSMKAYDLLSKAIDGGSKDPRAFYFRGLTAVSSGREFESETDYRAGAELEAKGNFGPSEGQALSRIQGSHRMKIESMRQQAQFEHQAAAADRSKARYQGIEAASGSVLSEPPAAAQPNRRPAPPATPPAAASAGSDPFANNSASGQAKVDSKDVLPDAATDPFADDAAPAAAGAKEPAAAGEDPFGGAGDAPAATGDDPFGAGAGAGADPFAN